MEATQDLLTIPRRALDVEDYIDIIRRHKGWILGPAFAALVIAVVGAFLWPDTYQSEATVQVIPPQVPERYVVSNVNSEMSQRINQMANQVLSRGNLTVLIQTTGLYKSELQHKPLEDVLDDMRKVIKISPVESLRQQSARAPISAFKISFEYSNRYLAQKVAAALVSGFINANLETLQSSSSATTAFMTEEFGDARKRLLDLENRMTQFRLQNAGRLPDELQANLTTLRTLEQQLSGSNESVSRIGQEKLLLESQIRIYRDQLSALTEGNNDQMKAAAKSDRLQQFDRLIAVQETQLGALRERYRDTYPDVQAAQSQLESSKKARDALLQEEAENKTDPNAAPKRLRPEQVQGGRQLEAQIAGLQTKIQTLDMELEERVKGQKLIIAKIDQYNERIQSSPVMEKQYSELTRDYGLAKSRYEELNAKKSQSEIATNLQTRGQGERLQPLDQASLPETPTKPKRLVIVGAGAALGLLLGIFTAGAREVKDTSLKNLKDARAYTNLPVLGTVPLLENDLVVRRKRRMTWLAWSAASIAGVVAMTASMYYYYYVSRV